MSQRSKGNGDDAPDVLERRIESALRTAPVCTLPEGFAARVAAALPVEGEGSRRAASFGYGRATALGCTVLLTAVLFRTASAAAPLWLRSMLSMELTGLSIGLGLWWHELGGGSEKG